MLLQNQLLRSMILISSVAVFTSGHAWAQSSQYRKPEKKVEAAPAPSKDGKPVDPKDAKATPAPTGDKLDTKELEEKYWAPKDTDFSVVQNRTYTKEKKFALTPAYGLLINDSYSEGSALGLTANYFFNERHGVELNYHQYDVSDNDVTKEFKQDLSSGVAPDHGKVQGYLGINYNWVPFYAKMSFLNKQILYFDMIISPGIGQVTYDPADDSDTNVGEKTSFAYSLDFSQLFFLKGWLAVRLDLRNTWFKEDVYDFRSGDKKRDKTSQKNTFFVGVMFLF